MSSSATFRIDFSGENRENGALQTGSAVCCTGGKAIYLASSANPALYPCIGLVREVTAQLHRPIIVHTGYFCLEDWTGVCGTRELAVRGVYFLSPNPGKLTMNANELGAKICQLVGKSVSANTLQLLLWDAILL